MLFGWLPDDPRGDAAAVLSSMRHVLRSSARECASTHVEPGFGIGALEVAADAHGRSAFAPALVGERFALWITGEAFGWPSEGGVSARDSRTLTFRQRVLEAYLKRGAVAIRDLDGEYQIAIWDRIARRLVVLNDRFGALPLYWLRTPDGFAFAGGVRGVLVAPGARIEPDTDAIREAMTFGGFRPGPRTNVRGVSMLPGASSLAADVSGTGVSRYWRWSEIPSLPQRDVDEVIDQLRSEWTRAITARLAGSARPGLTLSGGLDSRAILAEAARHGSVHAVTYGVPQSDDVRIARRAAQAVGAGWTLHSLYSGTNPDWLERRASFIQATDGLVDLVDLMHVEAIDELSARADLNLSGYIGDAVTGPSFNSVTTPEGVALALPYYGGALGMDWTAAIERTTEMITELGAAPARFALFEHKLPQSTNRITAALRPHIRVRRPFVDYRVFELAQGQASAIRGTHRLHERWLRFTYPECCRRIPHQKTGAPPLASPLRRRATRVARYAWRRGIGALAAAGLPVTPPSRSYQADHVHWRTASARDRIEGAILRNGSISCEVFGRDRVKSVVDAWFEHLAAPTQVIGALFVYETYHRDLAATLRSARAARAEEPCSSAAR